MLRRSFNRDWNVRTKTDIFSNLGKPVDTVRVSLPYDAVRDAPRSADSDQGVHTGYTAGGIFVYAKVIDVPADWADQTVVLEIEGAYRDVVVAVNGEFAAQRPHGYLPLQVTLDPYLKYGERNVITVDTRAHRDSRWYTGAGIHRPVSLAIGSPVHIPLDGVRITTPDVDDERAIVAVETTVQNASRATRTVRLETTIADADGTIVATLDTPVTVLPGTSGTVRLRTEVESPRRWSVDSPHLYSARSVLRDGGVELDVDESTFGVRTLQLDTRHGLRINGERVKMRGACIHHDNGVLGAASVPRADERRIELLKAAGFNAVRSSHYPISRALLDACDRHGMLVMDELTDVWTESKTGFDYSLSFPEWWERDTAAMVQKDFNHPSVVLYSIGNEIFETGTPIGSTWGRRIVERIRSLDDTRFVTNGMNPLLSLAGSVPEQPGDDGSTGPTDFNAEMAQLGTTQQEIAGSERVALVTEESSSVLDVVGWNYGDGRYEVDIERFPGRVTVGSETFPSHIGRLWPLILRNPQVIGDFTWTGWDYLGEAGLGRVEYEGDEDAREHGSEGAYPYLLANAGDLDITGHRRTISHYREVVFGLTETPYIAVHRPQHHGRTAFTTPWSWADAVSTWSWDVEPGSPVSIDVYSAAEEVELLLDGVSLGITRVGTETACIASFETTFAPGTLVAVARRGGAETGRHELPGVVGDPQLSLSADRAEIAADDDDLAFVSIAIVDRDGTVLVDRDRSVNVEVQGPGDLIGLGTGRARTTESFGGERCTTCDGRALAVIRPSDAGEITVTVRAEGMEERRVTISAR